jgi:hypothetical protein
MKQEESIATIAKSMPAQKERAQDLIAMVPMTLAA